MAQDIQIFNVVVLPGDTPDAPHFYPMNLASRTVEGVEFVIPAGNRSAAQFGLAMAGTVIIPSNSHSFITGDDEVIRWPLSGYPDSGAWQLAAYNTGNFPHTIQVRFLLALPQLPTEQVLRPLALSGLRG